MHLNNFKHISEENFIFPYNGKVPVISGTAFIFPGVKIIGDVTIGENVSVWFNSVIRGDVHYIKIGDNTNIQDLSVLHVTNGEFPLNIGRNVTIGHGAKIHGCTIEDLTLIGIGAIVLDGAYIESNSVVAAGAVVKPGYRVPSGKLVAGVPAKIVRDLSKEEIASLEISAKHYVEYSEKMLSSQLTFAKEEQ
jgi:carbonic anhydrase/acetyltransferase-like protein (isoleucine patch superfamily)